MLLNSPYGSHPVMVPGYLRNRLKSGSKESVGNDLNFFRLTIKSIKFED